MYYSVKNKKKKRVFYSHMDTFPLLYSRHVAIQKGGGQWVLTPPPPQMRQTIGFGINIGPDPMRNHKATEPACNDGPQSARQRNGFKWHFACGPMIVHF